MSFTADVYREIQLDIERQGTVSSAYAMRKIFCENGIGIVFSIHAISGARAVYFCIGEKAEKKQFPHWKGVNIEIVQIPDYGTDDFYVGMTQLPFSAGYIFEFVVEDLRTEIEKVASSKEALPILVSVLTKWKDFFQADKDLLMSPERQQGLYGELLFLEECIEEMGEVAIVHWAGSGDETHDFYINSHSVEVKTTSVQAPYYASISSEYQLDDGDISGTLILRYYALRKSQSDGEKLQDIIARIRNKLSDNAILQKFNIKLLEYGYLNEVAEHYTTGYFIRDHYYFKVCDKFPRLIKYDMPNGVANLTYSVSIAQCGSWAMDRKNVFNILKGGEEQC